METTEGWLYRSNVHRRGAALRKTANPERTEGVGGSGRQVRPLRPCRLAGQAKGHPVVRQPLPSKRRPPAGLPMWQPEGKQGAGWQAWVGPYLFDVCVCFKSSDAERDCCMLLATFNINNINRRLPNLLEWLAFRRPDIVCLQELKAPQDRFPAQAISRVGYQSVWIGQKAWNGVAILSRGSEPILIRDRLPGGQNDDQARYIEAAVKGIVIASIYAPNGNPRPGPKFDYKLAWLERLSRHVTALRRTGAPIALLGDFNVAPTDLDIYPTRSWDQDVNRAGTVGGSNSQVG